MKRSKSDLDQGILARIFNPLARAVDKSKIAVQDLSRDPAVLLGMGDVAASAATTGPASISTLMNSGATVIAAGVRIRETLLGKSSSGLGFLPAAAVSFYTCYEIFSNGMQKMAASGLISGDGLKDITLPATAFAAWGIGNGLFALPQKIKSATSSLAANPQLYMAAGSAAIAAAACIPAAGISATSLGISAVSLAIFTAALGRALQGEKSHDAPVETPKDFADKHITNKRLRAVGHTLAAGLTGYSLVKDPTGSGALMLAAYAFFAKGCAAFDSEKDKTIGADFAKIKDQIPKPFSGSGAPRTT